MPDSNDRSWDRDDDDDYDRPRRRRGYDDDRPRPQPTNGLAIAGLILGILGIFTCGVAGLFGLICSLIALSKPYGRGLAVGGIVASLFGFVIAATAVFIFILPATVKVREAAARMQDQNNMKQMGLGMHNAASMHNDEMSMYTRDDNGKVQTGLSFRVELLQHIEQGSLYRQFDKTQGWDSAKNLPLSNTPIKTYTSPYENGNKPSTQTPYRVFYGGGAPFSENKGAANLRSTFTDGTSNTILIVHAAEQVSWAEPRELKYDPKGPLPKLGQPNARVFNVAMADGTVRFVNSSVSEQTLRAAITANGGEVLPFDW